MSYLVHCEMGNVLLGPCQGYEQCPTWFTVWVWVMSYLVHCVGKSNVLHGPCQGYEQGPTWFTSWVWVMSYLLLMEGMNNALPGSLCGLGQ